MTDAASGTPETPGAAPRRRPMAAIVAAGAVVLLGAGALVAIPLGGWDTVALQSAAVPELAPGETYEGRHYSVSVADAWVGDTSPNEYETPEDGMTFVFVRATVRNEWREPDTAVSRLLTFDALDGLESFDQRATVRVVADGAPASTMQPGVETEVLLRWEVPAGSVSAGSPLALGVVDGRPDRAVLYSGTAWRDERTVVEVVVVPKPSDRLDYPWLD